jgi:hypothetical protein
MHFFLSNVGNVAKVSRLHTAQLLLLKLTAVYTFRTANCQNIKKDHFLLEAQFISKD